MWAGIYALYRFWPIAVGLAFVAGYALALIT
jgi:hypothetical protein